ncbi:MAG: VOC family protein [Solirubrobacterales bacterium]
MEIAAEYRQGEGRRILPDELRLGAAHLKVADLDRAVAFYSEVIGLQLRERAEGIAYLGAGMDDLIVLHERPDVRRVSRHAGLYHVAIHFPSQLELARVAQRILESRTPIEGASDHGTHEAIYLPDVDGNGLELAWDRQPSEWPNLADITAIAPRPLDMGGLFNLVSSSEPAPGADPGTFIGHVHLHVGSVADSKVFYRDLLGFDLITEIDTAVFVSAGGFHHHLAFNTWQGRGAPPAPDDAIGLEFWTIVLPAEDDVAEARERLATGGVATSEVDGGFEAADPSGNRLRVTAG